MVDPDRLPLDAIRAALREERDEKTLRRWIRRLRSDRRAGARALGERCARKLEARAAERARLSRLFERLHSLRDRGLVRVAGVDEVGVGPLAGPVVAAAVVLDERLDLPGLDDSKRCSASTRERLDAAIRERALAVGIGRVEAHEIDRVNIYRAALEAMRRAVVGLGTPAEHLLVDARRVPGVEIPQTSIVHGDAVDGCIAAASIVAKVHRDALMRSFDSRHPGYGFARHMGYATPQHLSALRRRGPSPIHRRSFAPVAEAGARPAATAPPPGARPAATAPPSGARPATTSSPPGAR